MFDEIHSVLDKVEGAVGDSGSGFVDDNVLLDPSPEINNVLGSIFTAIIQIFAFFRNLFKM